MKKKSIVFLTLSSILVLLLLFILVLTIISIYFNDNKIHFSDSEYNNNEKQNITNSLLSYQSDTFYDEIIANFNDYIIVKKNDLCGIVDKDNNIVEPFASLCDYNSIVLLSDHYYTIIIDDEIYLKRNGKVVSKLTNFDSFELYKDASDANSKYIAYSIKDSINNVSKTLISGNLYYVNFNKIVYIYDNTTGEVVKTLDGNLAHLGSNVNLENKYLYFFDGTYKSTLSYSTLFNKDTLELIDNFDIIGNYFISPDTGAIAFNSAFLKNSTYIAVYNGKYGVIDYNGNLIIPFEYDNISFDSNNTSYIKAKKNGLYGLIDTNNKIVLDFKYITISVFENNIIAITSDTVEFYSNSLQLISSTKLNTNFSNYGCPDSWGDEILTNLFVEKLSNDKDYHIYHYCGETTNIFVKSNGISFLDNNFNNINNPFNNNLNYYITYLENDKDNLYKFKIYDNNLDFVGFFDLESKAFSIQDLSYYFISEDSILISIEYSTNPLRNTYTPYYKYYIYNINSNTISESNIEFSSPANGEFTYLNEDYHYATEYLTDSKTFLLNIYDENNKTIKQMKAKNIMYLFDNYFAIQSNNSDWFISAFDL